MFHQYYLKFFLATGLVVASIITAFFTGTIIWDASRVPDTDTIATNPITPPPAQTVDFIAVGDIMLSRNVARHAEKSGKAGWIWENIRSFLHTSDFVVGNLEGPTNGTEVYSYQKVMLFNALPHLIRELPGANFAALSLANNHIMDQDEAGITTTVKLLSEIGIKPFGAGKTGTEALQPQIIERNGIKIAFIGASYAAFNDDGTGVNERVARMQDTEEMTLSIKKAQKIADFVVVTMHAGTEYTREPTRLQKSFSHAAIDAGADIVFGAHPHWTQGIEFYQGKYIFYSLGNFVFDQEFSPETKTGLAVKVSLTKQESTITLNHISLHPIHIENYGQPRLMVGEEKTQALKDIGQETESLTRLFTNR